MSTVSVTNLKHESASGNNITLDSSGRVGVGTSSPVSGSRLAVVGGGTQLSGGTSAQAGVRFQTVSGVATITGINNDNNAFNPLAFYTSGSEAMRIDTAGRVTMPYQPMAFAYRSLSGTTTGGNYEIVYDSVQVNVGSHYNSSTGRFTCPVTGVYRVTAFGMGQLISGSYNFYVRPTKNGTGLGGTAYNYGDSGDYKHASGAWLISCAAGDYLSIYSGGGSGYYGDGYAAASFELVG